MVGAAFRTALSLRAPWSRHLAQQTASPGLPLPGASLSVLMHREEANGLTQSYRI